MGEVKSGGQSTQGENMAGEGRMGQQWGEKARRTDERATRGSQKNHRRTDERAARGPQKNHK